MDFATRLVSDSYIPRVSYAPTAANIPKSLNKVSAAPSNLKDINQNQPGNESSDVCRVGDAALLRAAAKHTESADQLKHKPQTDGDEGGHWHCYPTQEHHYSIGWEQQNVSPEHARDRARRAQARHQQAGLVTARKRYRSEDVRQTSEHAANQVKYQITKVTQAIFDVIAENEKKEHVAEDVRDASMHEHGRDQREIDGNRRRLESRHFETLPRDRLHHNPIASRDVFTRNDLRGHGRKSVSEFFVRAEALEKYEDQHIDENKQIIDDRRRPATNIFISDWKKHLRLENSNRDAVVPSSPRLAASATLGS